MSENTRAVTARPAIQRRTVLTWGAATIASAGVARRAWAQSDVIRIGSTFDNSGVEKVNGAALFQGAAACIAAVNKAGGINGARLELVQADDQFDPARAKANALAFAADPKMVAVLTPQGTRQSIAVMEALPQMAIIGPNSGTPALRKKDGGTFWVRANFNEEIDKLIVQAASLGLTRIGLIHSNDPLGQALLAGYQAALKRAKLEPAVIGVTPSTNSLEVQDAARAVAKASPQVVLLGLAGTAPATVRALREAKCKSSIYGLSIASAAFAAMGPEGQGLGFSIVVPTPTATRFGVVRRYQADMQAIGKSGELSQPSLEGYINASVLVEGLRRAGPAPSRAAVIAGIERIEGFDLGNMPIHFGRNNREGNHFVDVAVIGANGRLLT